MDNTLYQLSGITSEQIAKINIEHQEKIIEATGRPFDPVKGFELIKEKTKNFSRDDPDAKKADELFLQLLRKNRLAEPAQSKGSSNNQESPRLLREQERARKLKLLALSLTL